MMPMKKCTQPARRRCSAGLPNIRTTVRCLFEEQANVCETLKENFVHNLWNAALGLSKLAHLEIKV